MRSFSSSTVKFGSSSSMKDPSRFPHRLQTTLLSSGKGEELFSFPVFSELGWPFEGSERSESPPRPAISPFSVEF